MTPQQSKEWFDRWGNHSEMSYTEPTNNDDFLWHRTTYEQMYQAFKARMIEEACNVHKK